MQNVSPVKYSSKLVRSSLLNTTKSVKTAINRHNCTRYKRRSGGEQPQRRAKQVFWIAKASHRRIVHDFLTA